jgi:NAD(P)H-flavin reductase
VRRRRETHDTWTIELEPVEGEPLVCEPGQFTMLYAFGIGEVPISVSGDDGGRLVHTVRAVGAVSEAICGSQRGSTLGVRGPFGNTWPVAEALGRDVVVVAGGIGLAPLRPALRHIVAHRSDYGRVALLYGGRTPGDLLYRRELRQLDRIALEVTVDSADGSWRGKVGVVPKLVGSALFDPAKSTALVCGPEIMIRYTVRALLARGLPAEQIHVSMERNMRCGVGHCGHCQLGPTLICLDGPVYRWSEVESLLAVREL